MVNYVVPDNEKKSRLYASLRMRCYDKYFLEHNTFYKGCVLCDEWLDDRELFCEWIDENYYLIDGLAERNIQLDKDILVPGNVVYAPTTCLFVPARMNSLVNSFTVTVNSGRDNGLPIGVHKMKNGKYQMSLSKNCKLSNVYNIETVEEAFDLYKEEKKKEFQKIADEYEDVVPDKVTEAFLQWMDIIDSLTVENWQDNLIKKDVENSYILFQKRGKKIFERLTCPTP